VAPYLAKSLARGETGNARHHLDVVLHGQQLRVLGWRRVAGHGAVRASTAVTCGGRCHARRGRASGPATRVPTPQTQRRTGDGEPGTGAGCRGRRGSDGYPCVDASRPEDLTDVTRTSGRWSRSARFSSRARTSRGNPPTWLQLCGVRRAGREAPGRDENRRQRAQDAHRSHAIRKRVVWTPLRPCVEECRVLGREPCRIAVDRMATSRQGARRAGTAS